MARDALHSQMSTAALSSYKKAGRPNANSSSQSKKNSSCNECHQEINKLVWSRYKKQWIECTLCSKCYKKLKGYKYSKPQQKSPADEASVLLVGSISQDISSEVCSSQARELSSIGHYIFDSEEGWKKSESMTHPTLRLQISVQKQDYDHIGKPCPNVRASSLEVVTDTGAQSCLWGLIDFHRHGFKKSDLISVK